MRARVISYNLAQCQAIEDLLNDWLEEVGEISIDRCVPLGNAGPERDSGAIIIFYRDVEVENDEDPVDLASNPDNPTCRQCKKRPVLEGMKMCGECREYQREYRKRQKDAKKKAMYP